MFGGKTPDVTPAQILAGLKWAAAQIVAWGWIDHAPRQIVLSGGATVLAGAWVLADALLRGKRADNADKLAP